jgi:hypothetical protein
MNVTTDTNETNTSTYVCEKCGCNSCDCWIWDGASKRSVENPNSKWNKEQKKLNISSKVKVHPKILTKPSEET